MLDKEKPMALGDIFSSAFILIKDTVSKNVIITAVFLIPAGILFAFGLEAYFKNLINFAKFSGTAKTTGFNPELASDFFLAMFALSFSLLIYYLAYNAAAIGVYSTGFAEAEGRKISLGEAFNEIFSITYVRLIGLALLLGAAAIVYVLIVIIVGIIIALISHILAVLFTVLLIMFSIALLVYIILQYDFAKLNIMYAKEGVFKSINKGFSLLKGYWWRTFGIVLLVSILVKFAAMLISTPISFVFEWDFISQYLKLISGGGAFQKNPEFMLEFMKSFGFVMGIIVTISSILRMLAFPQFYVAIFMDLKIRKGDFHIEEKLPVDESIDLNNLSEGESTVE